MSEPSLEFGRALHCGDLMYGNIGAAANEAARLAGLCKTLSQPVLMWSDFPRCFPDEMISLGFHRLRGGVNNLKKSLLLPIAEWREQGPRIQ